MTDAETRLTRKGRATRDRIIESAAAVALERGVQGMTNEEVRRAAGVSGSQLMHYFPDKESLLSAVIDWRAQAVMNFTQLAAKEGLDTFEGLQSWVDAYLDHEEACVSGCSFGSLAAELVKSETGLRGKVADGFDQWEELFRAGLQAMRDRGELKRSADPRALTNALMSSFQGGMLLSQASGDSTALRDALTAAMNYLSTFRSARSRA